MKAFDYDILTLPMTRKTSLGEIGSTLKQKDAEGWEMASVGTLEFPEVGQAVFLARKTSPAGVSA